MSRTLSQNLAARQIGTPGGWTSGAQFTRFVQLAGVARRILFIASNGELDADLLVEVFQATDVNGSGAVELTDVTTGETFTNGTDEGRVGLIEVLDTNLDDGYDFVGLRVTAGATDTFSAVALLGDLYDAPAENTEANGVAWVAGGSA